MPVSHAFTQSARRATGLLLVFLAITGAARAVDPLEVIIDPETRFQTMEGWGGHFYPQAWPYFSESFEREILQELQTTHARIRSYWYRMEYRNDNDDPYSIDWTVFREGDNGLVRDELLMQQLLHRRGVKLMFAAFRFPFWMIGESSDWRPAPDDKPPLPEGMDAEFVESIFAHLVYAWMHYGIVFEAVSMANEPDIGIYIKGLDPDRLIRLARDLRDRLRAVGYPMPQFYLPDVAAADPVTREYVKDFFATDGWQGLTRSFSYHSYRREMPIIRYYAELADRHGLPVWVTEQNHTHQAAPDRHEWSHAMKNALCLWDVLVPGKATLSLYFSYAMANSGGLGLYLPEKREWAPAYHMLRHFYNEVPPGSMVMESVLKETDPSLRSVAFLHPEGASGRLVLIHTGAEDRRIELATPRHRLRIDSLYQSQEGDYYRPGKPETNGTVTVPANGLLSVDFTLLPKRP